MDIHVDIRRFLEIHAWICYGFSDQGNILNIENFKFHTQHRYRIPQNGVFVVIWRRLT